MEKLEKRLQKIIKISLFALLFLALLLVLSVVLESCGEKFSFKAPYVGAIPSEEVLS